MDWMTLLLTQEDADRLVASLSKGASGKGHSTFTGHAANRGGVDMVCRSACAAGWSHVGQGLEILGDGRSGDGCGLNT